MDKVCKSCFSVCRKINKMKILLLSIGKSNDKIYAAAIEEFTQRLQKYYTTTWRFVHLKNNATSNIEEIKKYQENANFFFK